MTSPSNPEQPQPDRDWDAEWEGLTAPLAQEPRIHLISDAPDLGAGHGPRDYAPPEVEESWQPEEPPPLTANRSARLAWAGIVSGPLLMLLAVIAFGTAPVWFVGACIALFVGGCVWGFLRLPARRRDDGDDGAAV